MTQMNAHKNPTPSIRSSAAIIQNSRITPAGKNYRIKPYSLFVNGSILQDKLYESDFDKAIKAMEKREVWHDEVVSSC